MKTLPIRPVGPPPPAAVAAPLDARWRFARLGSAPHRLGFFAAALLMAASALWWAGVLVARRLGLPLPWAVPPSVAHALLFSGGFMPLFITGFLFTAGPKWLGLPEVATARLRAPVTLMVAGWALALAGFHTALPLAAAGVASVALGWSALVLRFARLLRASRAADRTHAKLVTAAGAIGALALAAAAAALAAGQVDGVRAATQLLLWGFLTPTFAAVSHRMIPFFSAAALPALDAWRPSWLLALMVGVPWLHAAFTLAAFAWWPLPGSVLGVQAAVEAPAAALMLWLAWRWGAVQSLRIRLLAMLHGGFVWFGVALALSAASLALRASSGDTASLGLAPTHALTIGYLGATLVAMATRVAAGHSGRPLAADNLAWSLYWTLQVAAVLRVAAALWPIAGAGLTLAAIACWTLATVGWAWRYGGWLGRPRADGRPG